MCVHYHSAQLFSFCRYPFILDPAAKSRIIRLAVRTEHALQHSLLGQLSLLRTVLGGSISLKLRVRRSHLLADAVEALLEAQSKLQYPLQVEFVGEQGVDTGGLTKEFFMLVVREVTDAAQGIVSIVLFCCRADSCNHRCVRSLVLCVASPDWTLPIFRVSVVGRRRPRLLFS